MNISSTHYLSKMVSVGHPVKPVQSNSLFKMQKKLVVLKTSRRQQQLASPGRSKCVSKAKRMEMKFLNRSSQIKNWFGHNIFLWRRHVTQPRRSFMSFCRECVCVCVSECGNTTKNKNLNKFTFNCGSWDAVRRIPLGMDQFLLFTTNFMIFKCFFSFL